MQTLRTAALFTILLLITIPCWAQLPPKPPVVVCPRVEKAPQLDGRIDPGEWAAAGVLSDFMLLGARGLPRLPTRVYVMHTTRALYIGAQLYDDRPSEIVADVTERDGRVYEDDCLELFIDTDGTRSEYAHFVVNSLGAKYDAYGHDVAENFDWNVFAAVNDTGWTVEIELPFDRGTPPLEGEAWVVGVCRNAARAGQLSTWCRHERDFHEPVAFGEMVFGAPLLTARVDELGDRLLGDNLAYVTVDNLGASPITAKLNVVVMGDDRRSHYFGTLKHDLDGRGGAQLYIPYKVRRCGPAWVAFSVTDEKGAVAWRTAALPIDLPDVSTPLDAVAGVVADAWKAWAMLAESEARDDLRREMELLQREWSYLDEQMAAAVGAPIGRLAALAVEVRGLTLRAEAMRDRIQALVAGRARG